jgi:hypothetical protein
MPVTGVVASPENEVGFTPAPMCDLGTEVNALDLRRATAEAVANAVHHHEQAGFDHALADKVSLGVVEVRAFGAE